MCVCAHVRVHVRARVCVCVCARCWADHSSVYRPMLKQMDDSWLAQNRPDTNESHTHNVRRQKTWCRITSTTTGQHNQPLRNLSLIVSLSLARHFLHRSSQISLLLLYSFSASTSPILLLFLLSGLCLVTQHFVFLSFPCVHQKTEKVCSRIPKTNFTLNPLSAS